jgi:hypothetical protein
VVGGADVVGGAEVVHPPDPLNIIAVSHPKTVIFL